jgi:hypothetical protein
VHLVGFYSLLSTAASLASLGVPYSLVHVSFKIFLQSLYFFEIKKNQPFKLHYLQNNLLLEPYISASGCKDVRNIRGSYFVKAFSARPSHS